MKKLVDDGKTELIIVSDSPTSQYRNSKTTYLTKSWAVRYKIKIQWIFTEAGHGKSAADGIGGNIKNLVKDKLAFNTQFSIKSIDDIIELIKEDTSIELMMHTKEDVKKVEDALPVISSLRGALKIHELLYDENGQVFMKNLPTDPIYTPVYLRTSRKKAVQNIDEIVNDEEIETTEIEE